MMKKTILIFVAALASAVFIFGHLTAHSGWGGGGGRTPPPKDAIPGYGGNLPGAGGPGTGYPGAGPPGPGGFGPSTPGSPATPSGAGTGGPSGGPRGAGTGGMARKRYSSGMGFERWEFWWEYNNDAYLKLKERLGQSGNRTGTSSFLVGRGRKDDSLQTRRPSDHVVSRRITPFLLAALDVESSKIRNSSIVALARSVRSGQASVVRERMKACLSSSNTTTRQLACLGLGILGSRDACGDLCDLMFDNKAGRKLVGGKEVARLTRELAALSLGLIGSDEACSRLRIVVETGNPKTDRDLIVCAITALGLLDGVPSCIENIRFLVDRLGDGKTDPLIKAHIPVALGRLGTPEALGAVAAAFRAKKQNNWVLQSCAIAIGALASLDDTDEIGLLKRYISDGKNVQTRHFAFIALAQIGARGGAFDVNAKGHREIGNFLLSEVVRPGKPQHRSWACLAAAIHAREHKELQAGVIDKLVEVFPETKNPAEKSAIAVSLGLLGARESAETLTAALEDTKDQGLRGYLCIGLGLMNWKPAAERIREFVTDESFYGLRLQAATALGMMGDRQAVPLLVDVLAKSRNMTITASSAKGLGMIGDAGAVPLLIGILGDAKAMILARDYAVVSLGIIGERGDLPWNAVLSRNSNYTVGVNAINQTVGIL